MDTKFYRFGLASVVKKFGENPIVVDIEGISAAPFFKVNGKMINLKDEASQSDLDVFSIGQLSIAKENIVIDPLVEQVKKEADNESIRIMSQTILKIADIVFKSEDKTEDMKKVEQLLLDYDKQKNGAKTIFD